MKAGDLVQLTSEGVEYMKSYTVNFKANTPYKLGDDGTGVGQWFLINSTTGGRIFLAEMHFEPYVENKRIKFSEGNPCRIVLRQDVSPFRAGQELDVTRINISGSYMVARPDNGGGHVIVSPDKCLVINPGTPEGTSMKLEQPKVPTPFEPVELTDTIRKSIKKQKALAEELLAFSIIMDPQAFIAGGAPRNWELNMEANDIDIFLRSPNNANESHLIHVLEAFGITEVFNKTTHSSRGVRRTSNCNEHKHQQDQKIYVVLEGNYQGQVVQFIFLRPETVMGLQYTRDHFDTSINMVVMNLNLQGELRTYSNVPYKNSMKSGVIFVYENGSAYGNPDHLERIHSYFPEAPLVDAEDMSKVMENPALAYELQQDVEDFRAADAGDDDIPW